VLAEPIVSDKTNQVLLEAGTRLNEEFIRSLYTWEIPALRIFEFDMCVEPEEDNIKLDDSSIEDTLKDAEFALNKIIERRNELKKVSRDTYNEIARTVKDTIDGITLKKPINGYQIKKDISNLIDRVISDKNIVLSLTKLKTNNSYIFSHSINVCALSTVTSFALGYSKEEILEIALGALIHDIGMVRVPEHILSKNGELTTDEKKEIIKHPFYGLELTANGKGISNDVRLVVFQHHERENGSGYPRRIGSDAIHRYAKIISVVDMYDIMTTRNYKERLSPYKAMRNILSYSNIYLDKDIVKAFLSNMAIYPIGSFVELNTKAIGLVVKANKNLPLRPYIKVLYDESGKKIDRAVTINLLEEPQIYIQRVVDEEQLGLDLVNEF